MTDPSRRGDAATSNEPSLAIPSPASAPMGLGESIAPSLFSGGVELSLPLRLPDARGHAPALSLSYSGGGNGPFGLGFDVDLASIAVRTSTGVPGYTGHDAYVSSTAGPLARRTAPGPGDEEGTVYVPLVEDAFDLVIHVPGAAGTSSWKVVDRNAVTTVYGTTEDARIADPKAPAAIAAWLVEESVDSLGNRICYRYKREDRENLPPAVYDVDRGPPAQRYIERISYGYHAAEAGGPADIAAFEIVFDYGEYDLSRLDQPGSHPYRPTRPWAPRPDPFSSYRTGFDVRTERLCRNILVFHRFAELGAEPCLVRAYQLVYDEGPIFSFLTRIVEVGYRRREDGSYESAELAPLELGYSRFAPPRRPAFERLVVDGLRSALPGYLSAPSLDPVDLDGQGLPGLLDTSGPAALWHAPLGGGAYTAGEPLPAFPTTGTDPVVLEDLEGNGRYAVVVNDPTQAGYYARTKDGFRPFQPFVATPTSPPSADVQSASLSGTGRADLFFFDGQEIVYFASLGAEGYAPPRRVTLPEGFPTASSGDETEILTFADVFGDGLAHRIRLRDGCLEVWPSLGHGRFAPKVTFADVPPFGAGIDAKRIYLAGIAGSGGADLVFAYVDRVEIYLNQSGNSFSAPWTIDLPRPLTDIDQLTFADILGRGSACLVLTRIEPTVEHLYTNLGGVAPGTVDTPSLHPWQLERVDNHRGSVTTLRHASSTEYALADARAGRPWVTRVPSPIAVVAEIVTTDLIGRTRAVQSFDYHDGFYDPIWREFRGFGYVESRDGETWDELVAAAARPGARVCAVDDGRHVAPRLTRTWFFTGSDEDADALAAQYAAQFFRGDPEAFPPPKTYFDPLIARAGVETVIQAHRALAGRMIRCEVYSGDGPPEQASCPFTVTEYAYAVRLLQPAEGAGRASLLVHDRETLAYDYDRRPSDPAVRHEFTLAVDAYGSVTRAATVYYPRRPTTDPDVVIYPEQAALRGVVELGSFTEVVVPFRRIGVRYEDRGAELGGLDLGGAPCFTWETIARQVDAALAAPIPYGAPFTPGELQSRTYLWQRTYFWDEAQTAVLPLGAITARALQHHEEKAVFSDLWLAETYGDKVDAALLEAQGGYVSDGAGTWWNRGLATYYYGPDTPERFYLAKRSAFLEPPPGGAPPGGSLRSETTFEYDAPYYLFVVATSQVVAPGVTEDTRAPVDYQALLPAEVIDLNDTVRQALYDPLGRVLATSVFKPAGGSFPRRGDGDLHDPADFERRPRATFDDVLLRKAHYLQEATTFAFYDDGAWDARGEPLSAITLARRTHVSELPPGDEGLIGAQIGYQDGLGRALESRREAEPGGGSGAPRWQVTGLTLYNNKGLPCARYLPRYAETPHYEAPGAALPPPTVTRYDALLRTVRVDDPKGFFSRVTYTPWDEARFDRDDTVKEAPYYLWFMATFPVDPTVAQRDERAALEQAAGFYNTPRTEVFDNAGHRIRIIHDNLGDVPPDAFQSIVAGTSVTSAELWEDVRANGYLVTRQTAPAGTWVTGKFQPYTPGFVLRLDPGLTPFAGAVTELLRQSTLVTYLHADLQGRQMVAIDPRLHYENVIRGTRYTNFLHAYAMGSQEPARRIGADAGTRWVLRTIYDEILATWDSRGTRTSRTFDRLQRTLTVEAHQSAGSFLAEVITYGDTIAGAAERNIRGQVHEHQDQGGVLVNEAYDLEARVTASTRQLAVDYRAPLDWAGDVPLQPKVWASAFAYDVAGSVVREVVDDGSAVHLDYFVSSRLASARVVTGGGDVLPIAATIAWSAADQPLRAELAGGVVAERAYEPTTLRLLSIRSFGPPARPLQEIDYTYDPVGHVTMTRDRSATHLFSYPQPEATNERRYDAMYQLVSATGRQHPGITAATHIDGFKQSIFAPLSPADPSDRAELAAYVETYHYDAARNLVELRHAVPLAPPGAQDFVRAHPVVADSNRLAGDAYDANGNPESLRLGAPVPLAWDYRSMLAHTGRFSKRAGGAQADYFVYDAARDRLRKVVEHYDAAGELSRVDARVYLGGYQVDSIEAPGGAPAITLRTLRVMAGSRLLAVVETRPDGSPPLVRSQLTDNLGSIAVETDGDGQPLSYEVYFPFGGTSVIAGRSELAVDSKVYRYSGKIADGGLGLYDYGVRYYPPWMSRWLNPDPTGAVNGLNLFQFVLDDPTSAVDSDGRIVWIDRRPGRGGRPPTITIRLNGVLVDNTHQNYTRAQMQAFARRLSDQIRRSYHGIGATVHFNARVSIRVSTVARRDDHVFRLVEPGQLPTRRAAAPHYVGGDYRPGGVVGYAPRTRLAGGLKQSNKIVYIRRDVLERRPDPASTTGLSVPMGASGTRRATLERTGPHEFGHTLNLDHPSPALPSNLMNQSTSPQAGMQISEEQVLHAEQEYEDGRLNGDDQGVDPRHLGP